MEKEIKIKTKDGYHIYGRMAGAPQQPLFIIVHGLPGSMEDELCLSATQWFAKHGYATFRFNLYGAEKDARQLMETTLETHASDIDIIVRYFRAKEFKKIYLAGHSYGGPSILLSKEQDFDSAALWDPSYKVSFLKKQAGVAEAIYLEEIKGYALKWGANFIVSEEMAHEADSLKWETLTKYFVVPIKIIVAENGCLVKGGERYFKNANEPKSLTVLKDATHNFNDTGSMREELFALTDSWFKEDN